MFDANFDPMQQLEVATANIEALVTAVNAQAKFLEDLSKQHAALTKQNYTMSCLLREITVRLADLDEDT